jgi:spore germination protein YaaH
MNPITLLKHNVTFVMKIFSVLFILFLGLQAQNYSSIHQVEMEYYKTHYNSTNSNENIDLSRSTISNQSLNKTVFGYHPYWMDSSWLDYDFSLLSTIAYFGAEANATGGIDDWHSWPPSNLITTAHNAGVEVVLTVTLFNSNAISSLLSNSTYIQNLITTLTNSVSSAGADGVNIDFEGLPSSQKENMVQFITDLKTAFDNAIPGSQITLATPAVDWSGAWDYDQLAINSDGLMIMAYDYHWSNGPTTGPVSPLTGWGTYNVTWTVNDYITWSGGLNDKLILGCPYYGYDWPAESSSAGANTTGSATSKTYSVAEPLAQTYGKLRDNDSQSPWYRYQSSGWHQCWYDDSLSLSLKYDLVNQHDLQGIGIWALGYDGDNTELWNAIDENFTSSSSLGDENNQPSTFQLLTPYPNPFNASTTIRFKVIKPNSILQILDINGRLLESYQFDVGKHEIQWNASEYASGIYFVSLSNGLKHQIQKMTLIK